MTETRRSCTLLERSLSAYQPNCDTRAPEDGVSTGVSPAEGKGRGRGHAGFRSCSVGFDLPGAGAVWSRRRR